MASLHKDPRGRSPYWFCSFKGGDGKWKFKSTKIRIEDDGPVKNKDANWEAAECACQNFERAANLARGNSLGEIQARKIVNEIIQQSGGEKIKHLTIKETFAEWLKNCKSKISPSTHTRYSSIVERFLKTLGPEKFNRSIDTLTPKDIQKHMDLLLAEGLSNKTVNLALTTLRIPLSIERRFGVITMNPAEAVEVLPERSSVRSAFTYEQVLKIVNCCNREWKGVVLLGYYHALRLGDASRLRVKNINFKTRLLTHTPDKSQESKSDIEVVLPLADEIYDHLLDSPIDLNNPESFLFPTVAVKRVNGERGLSESFRRILEKAGIDRKPSPVKAKGRGRQQFTYSFHSLRHTNITLHEKQGTSKDLRMMISNHASADTHEKYSHGKEDPEYLRKPINSLRRLDGKESQT